MSEGNREKKKVPIRDGLFTMPSSPDELPSLIGTKCKECNEVFFRPIRDGACPNCYAIDSMEETLLSRVGTLDSYTVVHQAPQGWEGPVPYGVATIMLPEPVFVEAALAECDLTGLRIGLEMELVIETVYNDEEGNEVQGYKFRPVST